MAKFDAFMSDLDGATVLELNELVKAIEEKFGVSAAAVASAGPAAAGEAAEEKTAFTVHLASAGESKIAVMKVIKEVLGLGLKEVKDLVDGAPVDIKTGVAKVEAEAMQKSLTEAGATVELK